MIINHNMNALNAHRNMATNTSAAGKSMEKLSSGLRINRAGDDAAGLAISEKMRGQISGLEQASRNASDGISLIQTAEGALNETHNILQRMRELAVQGANDTNTSDDRVAIEEEMSQLTEEISRISETTEFNGQNLLKGTFSGSFQIGANSNQTIGLQIGGTSANDLGLTGGVKLDYKAEPKASKLSEGNYTIKDAGGDLHLVDANNKVVGKIEQANIDQGKVTLADGTELQLAHKVTDGATVKIDSNGFQVTLAKGNDSNKLAAGNYTVSGTNLLNGDKLVGIVDLTTNKEKIKLTDGTEIKITDLNLVKEDLAPNKTFSVTGVDISTSSNASGAITTIDNAINSISKTRSQLGAVQNRLEHTTANLDNTAENLTSAESRVRDVDMAKEMMTFSSKNILQQAAQSMIAQANQQPQNVLSLLR